jgi:hypothetical protein
MPDKRNVKCHLCGSLFKIEAPADDCDTIVTLYYCKNCSEQKVDITCRKCGRVFQELPIKENEVERIESLCEECSKIITDIMFDPKKTDSKPQSDK